MRQNMENSESKPVYEKAPIYWMHEAISYLGLDRLGLARPDLAMHRLCTAGRSTQCVRLPPFSRGGARRQPTSPLWIESGLGRLCPCRLVLEPGSDWQPEPEGRGNRRWDP